MPVSLPTSRPNFGKYVSNNNLQYFRNLLLFSSVNTNSSAMSLSTDLIYNWCIGSIDIAEFSGSLCPGALANSGNTLCCNGCLIDKTQLIFPKMVRNETVVLSLANLECCEGDRFGGLGDATTCTAGLPVRPLTAEVSGSRYGTEVATQWTDVVGYHQTPYCLWFSAGDATLQTSASTNEISTNGLQTPTLTRTGTVPASTSLVSSSQTHPPLATASGSQSSQIPTSTAVGSGTTKINLRRDILSAIIIIGIVVGHVARL